MISDLTSRKIKNGSFLAACLVVMIHVSRGVCVGSYGWWFSWIVTNGIAHLAVPYFFVVSGYLLEEKHLSGESWVDQVKKRFWSLAIPFLCFAVMWSVYLVVISAIHNYLHGARMWAGVSIDLARAFGIDVFEPPELGPLWYLRCLVCCVLLSPLLRLLAKKMGLVVLFVLYLLVSPGFGESPLVSKDVMSFFRWTVSLEGVFFYTIGLYLRRANHTLDVPLRLSCVSGVVGVGIILARAICIFNHFSFPFWLMSVSLPFLVIAFWGSISSRRLPAWIVGCSFQIYLLHMFFVWSLRLVDGRNGDNPLLPVFETGVAIAGSICVTLAMGRFCPKVAGWVFGGRMPRIGRRI